MKVGDKLKAKRDLYTFLNKGKYYEIVYFSHSIEGYFIFAMKTNVSNQ